MGYRLVTPPAALPVTLAEAKQHLRVDHSDDDAKINALISAAVSYLDARSGVLGRCIVTQTWELQLDEFPDEEIEIALGPVQSVTSVHYTDQDGVTQVIASSEYDVDIVSLVARVLPVTSWPQAKAEANAVHVRFVAGTSAASVPQAIKQAILLLVSHWYEERSTVNVGNISSVLPFTVEALLTPFRRTFT